MTRPYGVYQPQVLDSLYREYVELLERRIYCLSKMREANQAGDDALWDAAGEEHDQISDELFDLTKQIAAAGGDAW